MLSKKGKKLYKGLKIDCEKCFGLCCVALYFSDSEGFPEDKDAGIPCVNLQYNYKCLVHKSLKDKGFKGCLGYDCFGAGQKISQITFKGRDWNQFPEDQKKMFDSFLIMKQLHEMKWYLTQAYSLQTNENIKDDIISLLESIEQQSLFHIESLLLIDLDTLRSTVNNFLRDTSDFIRVKAQKRFGKLSETSSLKRIDYFGIDLRKSDLRGADLRGSCLIAANLSGLDLDSADFIGADMRDTNIKGANLSNSIFLTQSQINSARGDSQTKLPDMIERPTHWIKHKMR